MNILMLCYYNLLHHTVLFLKKIFFQNTVLIYNSGQYFGTEGVYLW